MPIYEFYCKKTGTIYSFLSQRLIGSGEIPKCPANATYKMERVVSSFSVTGRHREVSDGEGPDLDDPRMEAAMAEMERDMSGMDEENPDPRQMGRLMRKMADLSGEPLDGAMEEMVRKMEEGADLDRLEEEFGDAMDDDGGDGFGDRDEAAGETQLQQLLKRARRRGPKKDPKLYDWRDFAP